MFSTVVAAPEPSTLRTLNVDTTDDKKDKLTCKGSLQSLHIQFQ